jgi:hypothetical protein
MPRRPGVQLRRRRRGDGSITYSLRIRSGGADEAIALGNSSDGWDEARAERAREQMLAKIELGLWQPGAPAAGTLLQATGNRRLRNSLASGWGTVSETPRSARGRSRMTAGDLSAT